MNAAAEKVLIEDQPVTRPAYDPNNLDPLDAEARKYDDNSEGIDWDEIIATTQDDELAGRYAYNSDDYPTEEAAAEALKQHIHAIFEEVLREEAAAKAALDASGP